MFNPARKVNITLRAKNVNNKRVMREVDEFFMNSIRMTIRDLADEAHQQEIAQLLEDVIQDFNEDKDIIDRIQVICDRRNNSKEERDAKRVHFTVRYQQKNCLNTTELHYIIEL